MDARSTPWLRARRLGCALDALAAGSTPWLPLLRPPRTSSVP
ncbi:hypothetical protein I547_7288 [Mycobacterium kansasii 824]|uniref:Uncharacterized protein n=1 Tax=Mycobacterium kansasii TaxID=1768 RepID=A0A1V3X3R5_MYCKA|nr:hypothetical protein I547_7288 [Mycobacterium kansasii 824]OOK73839.1 hypothetical protein BZL30_4411 [Mycobacterium kansasii]